MTTHERRALFEPLVATRAPASTAVLYETIARMEDWSAEMYEHRRLEYLIEVTARNDARPRSEFFAHLRRLFREELAAFMSTRPVDKVAVAAGAIRLASGISFLVAPGAANRLWGDDEDSGPTASLLLRSMGYRDALIGALLLRAGWRGDSTVPGWFLASAGADAADLLGGIANHDRMTARQQQRGLGGAAIGIGIGLLGAAATRSRR